MTKHITTEQPFHLFMKKSKSYTEEQTRFATKLFMYSPKAYEFLRESFHLPCPRTIRRWLSRINGSPGIFQEALDFLEEKSKLDAYQYQQCSLMIDGMSIMKHMEFDPVRNSFYGYVDYGFGAEESLGEASEALVFLASSVVGRWKIPIGYLLINGKPLNIDIKIKNRTLQSFLQQVFLARVLPKQ